MPHNFHRGEEISDWMEKGDVGSIRAADVVIMLMYQRIKEDTIESFIHHCRHREPEAQLYISCPAKEPLKWVRSHALEWGFDGELPSPHDDSFSIEFDRLTGFHSEDTNPQMAVRNSARLAAQRIHDVINQLKSFGINSISEQISTLEDIGNALQRLADDGNRDMTSFQPMARRALTALAGIFDVIGSERGAQILVSGAVAGLVGVIGWPAEVAYGLTLAAWTGKDALLKAVERTGLQDTSGRRVRSRGVQKS
jgi:hypothetical protein